MKTLFNKSLVTHITIYPQKKLNYFWREEKTSRFLFWKEITSAGYYDKHSNYYMFNKEEMQEKYNGFIDSNGQVVQIPYIQIYINSECVAIKYFASVRLAEDYCKEQFSNANYHVK